MKYVIALLPFLSSAAAAQEDVYRVLQLGHRVQVTFPSGNTLTGKLIAKPKKEGEKIDKIDYTRATEITLDLSWEYPGLNGTMTIRKDQIKAIRKLRSLDPQTLKRLKEEKAKAMAELAQREKKRQAFEADRIKKARALADRMAKEKKEGGALDEGEELVKRAEEMRKGLQLLTKYPPPEWGPKKLQLIQQKNQSLIPMTPEEREFVQNIEVWMKAYDYRQSQAGGEKGQ